MTAREGGAVYYGGGRGEEERHDHGIKYASYFIPNIGALQSVSPGWCDCQAKVI